MILFLEILFLGWLLLPLAVIASLFLIGPAVAPVLKNVPFYVVPGQDEYQTVDGHDGFFTTLQPGQVKIIERGERFVTCIMRWPGHTFQCIKDPVPSKTELDKWQVVDSDSPEQDAYPVTKIKHPFPSWWFLWWLAPHIYLWRFWKLYMYHFFGYVFTGIAPFQTVRTYPIEYFEESTSADGRYVLKRKRNRSDHYRVAEFYYAFPLDSADTSDMIPAELAVGLTTEVYNPYALAYNTDKAWASRFASVARSIVNDQTRRRSIRDIVGSTGDSESSKKLYQIYDDIQQDIQEQIKSFGLHLKSVNTPSRKTADPEAIKQLGAPGFAAAEGEARTIEAEKEAAAIGLMARAITDAGDSGKLAAQIEGRIRAVGDAGDRAILSFGDGGNQTEDYNRTVKAILAELRNGGKNDD